MSLRQYLAILSFGLFGASAAGAAELSEDRFVDWNYYNARAWQAADRGQLAEAAHRFQLSIDALRPEWERAPRLMARSYADLAWVLYRQGRTQEARPLAQWALDVRSARGGPESESVGQSLYQLAVIEDAESHYPEAESLLRRSLAVWEKRVGAYDLRVTYYLIELGRILRIQRKWDEAEAVYRRVLGRPERALPPKHPFRVAGLIGLGAIYTAKGEPIRANFQNAKLVTLLPDLRAADFADVADPLNGYVQQLKQAGRGDDASKLETAGRTLLAKVDASQRNQSAADRRALRAVKGIVDMPAGPSVPAPKAPAGPVG